MWNFQGSWFLVLGLPRDLKQFCGISRSGALFCLEFPGVKQKKEKFQWGFQRSIFSTPSVWFFSGTAQ